MTDIVPVSFVRDGNLQVVAVAEGSAVEELHDCLSAVFQCDSNVVGLKDVDTNVVFPLSVLVVHPGQFRDSVYELLLEQHEEQCSSAGGLDGLPELESMTLSEKIDAVRESVGLIKVDAINLNRLLSTYSETEEIITRFEFMTAIHTLGDAPGKNSLVSILFDVFSQGAEFAIISELVNGLSVFCGGSLTDKILNSFALQDTDRDGYISRADMVTYMRSVFTLLFQISPELADSAGCDPEDLAVRTTNHAFQSMGLKTGELMSFAQYKVWYVSDNNASAPSGGLGRDSESSESSGDSESESSVGDSDGEAELDIFDVQNLLGLHESRASDVVSAFLMFADGYGRLSKPRYLGIFDQLLGPAPRKSNAANRELLEVVKERIFNVYEIAESGFLNVRSLTSGISLFCGGSWDDKALAVFMAFGLTSTSSSLIAPDVMTQHIISIFAMMSEFDRSFLSDSTAVMVAQDMVKSAFSSVPVNPGLGEPAMSCVQFATWLSSGADNMLPSSSRNGQAAPSQPQNDDDEMVLLTDLLETSDSSSDEDDDDQNGYDNADSALAGQATSKANASLIQHELKYAKRTLGLHMFSADDLLDVVGEFSKEGVISAAAWDEAILHMLMLSGASTDQFGVAAEIARNIFNRLDTPGLLAVDYSNLILSLSNFCNSPLEDRVMVAFTVLDASRGTEVDYDELLRYFRSMYMAATVLSPTLLSTMVERNLNPNKLAELILDDALERLNFKQVNQQYFGLENMTEIAEYCLERLG